MAGRVAIIVTQAHMLISRQFTHTTEKKTTQRRRRWDLILVLFYNLLFSIHNVLAHVQLLFVTSPMQNAHGTLHDHTPYRWNCIIYFFVFFSFFRAFLRLRTPICFSSYCLLFVSMSVLAARTLILHIFHVTNTCGNAFERTCGSSSWVHCTCRKLNVFATMVSFLQTQRIGWWSDEWMH